ncbi:unnamed protein product [Closterium sp. NIES-64]|nr:unnamed protein product [Closterium sp. NIES-64]
MHPPHLHLSPSQVSHYRPSILYSQKPLPRDQEPQPPPVIPRQIHPHTDTRPQTHLSLTIICRVGTVATIGGVVAGSTVAAAVAALLHQSQCRRPFV